MVYTAPKNEIEQLKDLFSRSGFSLTGISIAPFAIQNLLRTNWLETGEDIVPSLHISGDCSRIDIFSSGNLVFTRGIKVGINSLIQGIKEGLGHAQRSTNRDGLCQKDTLQPHS
jgi:Tfp pilus assembly PilM family ATPase